MEPEQTADLLIWWLCRSDYRAIGDPKPGWPHYLRGQYRSREGRPGRGRLWVADEFGNVAVDPWPDTPIGKRLAGAHFGDETYGGIVIRAADARLLLDMPGIVTDLCLQQCLPASA